MAAGQNVLFLSGTKVFSGGYLHAIINNGCIPCLSLKTISLDASGEIGDAVPEILNSDSRQSTFSIYPNPTNSRFTLEITGENGITDAEVTIFSMMGDRILQKHMSGVSKQEFSLHDKPPGIYLVMVMMEGRVETARVIKNAL